MKVSLIPRQQEDLVITLTLEEAKRVLANLIGCWELQEALSKYIRDNE